MADPRGHGFNRGNGKWHARTVTVVPVNPADLGWQPDNGDGHYRLNGVKLQPAPDTIGWVMTQTATIGGEVRINKLYVKNALLPKLTEDLQAEVIQAARQDGATERDTAGYFYRFNQDPNNWGWQRGKFNETKIDWRRWPGDRPPESAMRI